MYEKGLFLLLGLRGGDVRVTALALRWCVDPHMLTNWSIFFVQAGLRSILLIYGIQGRLLVRIILVTTRARILVFENFRAFCCLVIASPLLTQVARRIVLDTLLQSRLITSSRVVQSFGTCHEPLSLILE